MKPEDARKLMGGFATGTLTEAERAALFAAALEDQALFDELSREEGLRELLGDAAAKATLLAALEDRPKVWWWSWKPAVGVLAMAGIVAVAVVVTRRPPPVELTAKVEAPAPPPTAQVVAPESAPSPVRAKTRARVAASGPAGGATPAPPVADKMLAENSAKLDAVRAEAREAAPKAPMVAPFASPMLGVSTGALSQTSVAALRQAILVMYTVVRREGGEWVPVGEGELKQSDTVALRFTPSVDGFLFVGDAEPVAVAAEDTYTTAPLSADQVVVRVVFSRTRTVVTAPAAPTQPIGGSGSVMRVSGTGAIGFTIPLPRK